VVGGGWVGGREDLWACGGRLPLGPLSAGGVCVCCRESCAAAAAAGCLLCCRDPDEQLITPWVFVRYMVVGAYVGCATVGAFVVWYMFDNFMGIDLSQVGRAGPGEAGRGAGVCAYLAVSCQCCM
jgi:hypothetical protein